MITPIIVLAAFLSGGTIALSLMAMVQIGKESDSRLYSREVPKTADACK